MDNDNTISFNLTGNDKRRIRDEYEQGVRDLEQKKTLDAINDQLRTWNSLFNAILDLNNTLLVVSTLVNADSWATLHDERLLEEISASVDLVTGFCKELDDPLLTPWQLRLEIIVTMYLTALRLFVQQGQKAALQSAVQQIGGKPIRLPVISVQAPYLLRPSSAASSR
ncbi:MAG TPA: hypothetical protein VMT24_14260 [Aggregatilineaceae bacterium]|nr:hypothetical protein [Aggregatilineaceae bacterium]